MAVGYVHKRHCSELFDKPFAFSLTDSPDRVADLIRRREVEQWFFRLSAGDNLVDLPPSSISEKHRAGLRAYRQHMPRAVVLLVLACALVLANDVGFIFVKRTTCGNPGLRVFAHAKAVDVQARRFFD